MCDRIIMPNGDEITSFDAGYTCLCRNTHIEVLKWIFEHLEEYITTKITFAHLVNEKPESYYVPIGTTINIERDPFGWIVTVKQGDTLK